LPLFCLLFSTKDLFALKLLFSLFLSAAGLCSFSFLSEAFLRLLLSEPAFPSLFTEISEDLISESEEFRMLNGLWIFVESLKPAFFGFLFAFI